MSSGIGNAICKIKNMLMSLIVKSKYQIVSEIDEIIKGFANDAGNAKARVRRGGYLIERAAAKVVNKSF